MGKADGKKILFIIAPSDFRDEELFDTQNVLEEAGAKTFIASRQTGEITGAMGGGVKATIPMAEAKIDYFDAIVFVGGSGAAEYFDDPIAHRMAKEAFAKGKILAAICIAPSILANAGLLKGKNATCFSSEAENLKEKGANYSGLAVTRDGNIITANGPEAARAFGEEIVEAISG